MTTWNANILNDPIGGALEMQFGFPKCLTNLTKSMLSLLPGDILGGLAAGMAEGRSNARNSMGAAFEDIHNTLGILQYNSDTGKLSLFSDSSQGGVDNFANTLGQSIGEFQAKIQAGQSLADELEAISNCLSDYELYLEKSNNKVDPAAAKSAEEQISRTKGQFLIKKALVEASEAYITKVNGVIDTIGEILLERENNPDLIPSFDEEDQPQETPIFRLAYGPPLAKKGKYLLSVDGLYYDSRERVYAEGSPVPTTEDLQFIPAKDKWLMDHSPNLGGRGTSYSIKDLNTYVDTLFDTDKIDNNEFLKEYYDADEFLQTLESQRNTVVSNLNKNLKTFDYDTYDKDSAIYQNYIQQIKSENAGYQQKINKRKKQIEVAVKAPDLFGYNIFYSKGNIPVNDFSYLSSINLSVEIEKQKGLIFDHGEISGLVLPVIPLFVENPGISSQSVLTPLKVSESGVGAYIEGDELTDQPLLSITTGITTDGLKAIYPFTTGKLQTPDSSEFTSRNTATYEGGIDNAQLVTNSPSMLFQKGMGLPYLNGIVSLYKQNSNSEFKGEDWSTYPFVINTPGSYVKLPDSSTFYDLLYSKNGATIDLWTYVPGLFQEKSSTGFPSHPYNTSSWNFNLSSDGGAWCDLQYYRVLMGCENTGGENLNLDQSAVIINRSSNNVRGMLMGFSRDPRMYYTEEVVSPASTDLNVRENFGGYITSVSSTTVAKANGIEGVWTLSSAASAGTHVPVAAWQASGTFKTKNIDGVAKSYDFTVTDPGDKYTVSSNDLCCVLYTSGYKSTTAYIEAVSSVLSVAPFNHNYMPGTTSSVFFIAPTQSYNTSSVGFVKNTECRTNPDGDILKFVVSTKDVVDGVSFSDITSKFVNLQIVFEPYSDSLKLYINGVLFKKDKISSTFGVTPNSAPQVPSFIIPPTSELSSFYYNKSTVNQSSNTNAFNNGPKNYSLFTPWIVGGGWTDGRPVDLNTSSGGFLDVGAGIHSPYNGYIGSLKFYDKALNITEIKTNYTSQKKFFENIDL